MHINPITACWSCKRTTNARILLGMVIVAHLSPTSQRHLSADLEVRTKKKVVGKKGETVTVDCSSLTNVSDYFLRWTKYIPGRSHLDIYHYYSCIGGVDAAVNHPALNRYERNGLSLSIPDIDRQDSGRLCCELEVLPDHSARGKGCTEVILQTAYINTVYSAPELNGCAKTGSVPTPRVYDDDFGEIKSPWFGISYPPNIVCIYEIRLPSWKQIYFNWIKFDVEYRSDSADCLFDYLQITTKNNFTQRYCGVDTDVLPTTVANNEVVLEFHSNDIIEYQGFKLYYMGVDIVDYVHACTTGETIHAATAGGTISSPDFGDDKVYGTGLRCQWDIIAEDGNLVKLHWTYMDIPKLSGFCSDSLQVQDDDAVAIEQLCGNIIPEDFLSSSNRVRLLFTTDSIAGGTGFQINYEVVIPTTVEVLTHPSGSIIASIDRPQSPRKHYSSKWVIQGELGKTVEVTFKSFDVQSSPSCSSAAVTVYDGSSEDSPVLGVFCGKQAPFQITSFGQSLTIVFEAEYSGTLNSKGFLADYVTVQKYSDACGVNYYPIKSRTQTNNPKYENIVGGSDAVPHSLPWMINILKHNGPHCGAALLAHSWIVTAAHCFGEHYNHDEYIVRAGDHVFLQSEDTEQTVNITRIYLHPDFDPGTYNSDIALVELASPLVFNKSVQPVCLSSYQPPVGQWCIISGWGRLKYGGWQSNALQQVYVPLKNDDECKRYYMAKSPPRLVNHNMLCAGLREGGIDACNADSGGPLVCGNAQSQAWDLTGIISWGVGCADVESPGVYTRLSSFLNWINQTTNGVVPIDYV